MYINMYIRIYVYIQLYVYIYIYIYIYIYSQRETGGPVAKLREQLERFDQDAQEFNSRLSCMFRDCLVSSITVLCVFHDCLVCSVTVLYVP